MKYVETDRTFEHHPETEAETRSLRELFPHLWPFQYVVEAKMRCWFCGHDYTASIGHFCHEGGTIRAINAVPKRGTADSGRAEHE